MNADQPRRMKMRPETSVCSFARHFQERFGLLYTFLRAQLLSGVLPMSNGHGPKPQTNVFY